ncbi:MAG: glycine cleavage system protein GcvH [Geobacteraceae bacterium]|jgi:glycine cleavage system H protein
MAEFLQTTFDKFIFRVKTGYFYTDDDYWMDILGSVATVGVTDYLQKSSGDVAFVEPAAVGKEVKKGGDLGEIETIKVTLNLLSPVTGKIIEINQALDASPELINSDPYGAGWICRIELADPEGAKNGFLQAEAYMEIMKVKIEREAG